MRIRVAGSLAFAAVLAAGAQGCATTLASHCSGAEQPQVLDVLYFGTARDSGAVTDEQWQDFLAREITPRFPQGLTAWDADGQWQSKDGAIAHERSHVLQLVHADGAPQDQAVETIAQSWKTRYGQESVLRVRSDACVRF